MAEPLSMDLRRRVLAAIAAVSQVEARGVALE